MPSAMPSMDSGLWSTFLDWELSASSPEKFTRMEVFISIASSISDGSSEADELISLMSTVVTQTSSLLGELHGEVTTMRSRMVTSYVGASNDPSSLAQNELRRIGINGLKSRMRAIETIFGNWFITWIPRLLRAITGNWPSTPIGGLHQFLPCMSHQEESRLLVEMLMVEMRGASNLTYALENHS
jgi:hypothetical protein